MYQETAQQTPQGQPAIKAVYDRIEKNLNICHEVMNEIEGKINGLYQSPSAQPDNLQGAKRESNSFHDAMIKINDMTDHLVNRMEKAKQRFNEAI